MPRLRVTLLVLLSFVMPLQAHATECPNCALEFPSTWKAQEHFWGTRVEVEDQTVDVKVQTDDVMVPLGPGDEADERVWLEAEVEAEGLQIEQTNARIVRTVSREPAVVLDYRWKDADGAQGRGVRLVRRCGVRLIFEHRGGEQRLDALLQVSDRVRYTRPECTKHNADVIPLEVLEQVDKVRLPDVADVVPTPADVPVPPPTDEAQTSVAPTVAPTTHDGSSASSDDDGSMTGLLVGVAATLVGLLALIGVMLRSGGREPLDQLPPLRDPSAASSPRSTDSLPRDPTGEAFPSAPPDAPPEDLERQSYDHPISIHTPIRTGPRPPLPPAQYEDEEASSSDEFGDETTDSILPAGTYGLRGAGGGDDGERVTVQQSSDVDARVSSVEPELGSVPAGGPISVPSHAVVSYTSTFGESSGARRPEVYDPEEASFDEEEVIRVSPVESVLASLGISTWLDFTAPGMSGVSFLPSTVSELVEVQNGGRFGYGWLLLLGLRRKNMDLVTLNGEARVKKRFGEGWLVGVFAFGNVLWVGEGQRWEIRTLEGERIYLGDSAEAALRRLAEDEDLRNKGASRALVERCRAAVGELLPGWVYLHHGEPPTSAEPLPSDGHAFEPVEIVPFLELLAR